MKSILILLSIFAHTIAFSYSQTESENDYYQDIISNVKELYMEPFQRRHQREFIVELVETRWAAFRSTSNFKSKKDRLPIKIQIGKAYRPDEFLYVLCHELGHGIASGQKIPRGSSYKWEKPKKDYVEGEADYFSVKCMKKYLKNYYIDKSITSVAGNDVRSACQDAKDKEDCLFILNSVKRALTLGKDDSYARTDNSKVSYTLTGYPSKQCRLDTIRNSYFRKKRPRCWHSHTPSFIDIIGSYL